MAFILRESENNLFKFLYKIKYNLDSIFTFSGKNNDLLSGLSEHLHTHTTSPNYLFSGHVTFCHEAGVACQLLPQSSPRVASSRGW